MCASLPPPQPTLTHALLAVLPATVRQLKLNVRCCDPLFLLLCRFPQLESVSVCGRIGNGVELGWDSRAAAAVMHKFTCLQLDFRGDAE